MGGPRLYGSGSGYGQVAGTANAVMDLPVP